MQDVIGWNAALLRVILAHPDAGAFALRSILGADCVVYEDKDAGGVPLGRSEGDENREQEIKK